MCVLRGSSEGVMGMWDVSHLDSRLLRFLPRLFKSASSSRRRPLDGDLCLSSLSFLASLSFWGRSSLLEGPALAASAASSAALAAAAATASSTPLACEVSSALQ